MCAFRHRRHTQSRLPFPRVASSNPEVGAKPSQQEPDGPASPSIFRGSHFSHVASVLTIRELLEDKGHVCLVCCYSVASTKHLLKNIGDVRGGWGRHPVLSK